MVKLERNQANRILADIYPRHFSLTKGKPLISSPWVERGFALLNGTEKALIQHKTLSAYFKALGCLMAGPHRPYVRLEAPFEFRGLMIDVSRNGVLKPSFLKETIVKLALLGVNRLCLYTEDTYEVRGHPLFGYQRGRYSQQELRDLDRFAALFGIEMFPCIQTLGHLSQVLKYWQYGNIKDNDNVLNVHKADTYKFIETMIRNACAPYKSRLVHIGMDETWGLGRGAAFEPNKKIDPRQIYLTHLQKVAAICRRLRVQPAMWGDIVIGMSGEEALSRSQTQKLPKDVWMDFWNYEHSDTGYYEKTIKDYRRMGFEPIVSPGMWNWSRMWGFYPKAALTISAFMTAAKQAGVKKVLQTMWGDDGQESPWRSNWPGIALWAEHAWNQTANLDEVKKTVEAVTGDAFDSYVLPTRMDAVSSKYHQSAPSLARGLLYDDPLFRLYASHAGGKRVQPYFENQRKALAGVKNKTSRANRDLFDYGYALADCLSLKADLGNNACAAYKSGNKGKLKAILRQLPAVIQKVNALWQARRRVWLAEMKPQGLEVIDLRFGGQVQRLRVMQERLSDYLAGRSRRIEEFDEKPQNFLGEFPNIGWWTQYKKINSITEVK